jgi:Type II restriction endonuclease EcoO109I
LIAQKELDFRIKELLSALYKKRFDALQKLKLTELLAKNPYLYRSIGGTNPFKFLEKILQARISSSDETIFGNDFFEPLAFWSATKASENLPLTTVNIGAGAGQDIAIENAQEYLAISVKSGKNIFNAQSDKGQTIEFSALASRVKKNKKQFRKIIGYAYGRKVAKKETEVEKLAGQVFWKLLTGELDFYIRLSQSIGKCSVGHCEAYEKAFELKTSALLKEFSIDYISDSGEIRWDEIVKFNSAEIKPKQSKGVKRSTKERNNKPTL